MNQKARKLSKEIESRERLRQNLLESQEKQLKQFDEETKHLQQRLENTLRFENKDTHTYLTIGNSENSIITLTGKVINLLNDNEGYVYLNPFNTMLYFKEDESYKDLATIVTTYDERIKALEDMGKRLDDINGEVIE